MADDIAIELPSVVQRFREAGEALTALRERLQALELAEDSQVRSAQSIDSASGTLSSVAQQLASATEALRAACAITEQAMESARGFFESTDLSTLRTSMAGVETAMATSHRSVDDQLRALGESVASNARTTDMVVSLVNALSAKIDSEVAAARGEAAQATAAKQALEAKIQAIPEKSRRKLGL